MKLTIHIEENKVAFFLELLKSFEDFITVEKAIEENGAELTTAHKKIIDQRLAKYKKNPENLLDWEDVQKELSRAL